MTTLTKPKLLAARDLALQHLPKARSERDKAAAHGGRRAADLVVASMASIANMTRCDGTATAIEKQAAALIELTLLHPDAPMEELYPPVKPVDVAEAEEIATTKKSLQEIRTSGGLPALESAILEAARALCELTGQSLPPWMVNTHASHTAPTFGMTKNAMVRAHAHEWPSIERDMKDASENGLAAAKAGPRRWDEAVALEWVRASGKLLDPTDALSQSVHRMASLPGKKNILKG